MSFPAPYPASDRVPFICNATDPIKKHPAVYMVDNNNMTFWQSTANTDEATITVDIRSSNQKVRFKLLPFYSFKHISISLARG